MKITPEILVSWTETEVMGVRHYFLHLQLLDIMELKRMMEKLGQAKTHLELKKMIAEVDTTNSGYNQ